MWRMRIRVGRYLLIRGPGKGPRGHRFDIWVRPECLVHRLNTTAWTSINSW